MKFILLEQNDFRPVRLDIVFETRDELLELFARLNLTSVQLQDGSYAHPLAEAFIKHAGKHPHVRLIDLENKLLDALEKTA